jgi:hypothetical protein
LDLLRKYEIDQWVSGFRSWFWKIKKSSDVAKREFALI